MYRTRGKPQDPWNVAAAKKHLQLAEALRVNSLQQNKLDGNVQEVIFTSGRRELAKRRQNFEEFKLTYQDRFKRQVRHGRPDRDLQSRNISFNLEEPIFHVTTATKTIRGKRAVSRLLSQNTIKSVKTASTNISQTSIICPPINLFEDRVSFLNKISLKDQTKTTMDEGVQVGVLKELLDVNKEIEVASSQLEHIKRLLKATQILNPVEKNADMMDNKHALLNDIKQDNRTLRSNQKSVKNNRHSSKTNKLVATLHSVNDRIQTIQDKYLAKPRIRYKSVKDVLPNNSASTGSLHLIYQNQKCCNKPKQDAFLCDWKPGDVCNKPVEKSLEKRLKKIQNLLILNSPNSLAPLQKAEDIENKSILKHLTAKDNKVDVPSVLKTISYLNKIPEELTVRHSPRINMMYSIKNDSVCENELKSTTQEFSGKSNNHSKKHQLNDVASTKFVFEPILQEAVLQSDYLMKEFKIDGKDVRKWDINHGSTFKNFIKKKSIHCIPSSEMLRKPTKCDLKQYSSIVDHVLKNSLYYT